MMPETRRFAMRVPHPLWISLVAGGFVVVVVGLQLGLPIYRQNVAMREVERLGGGIVTEPRGPQWLRDQLGDERMKLFDKLAEIDLCGTQATDAALAYVCRLPGLRALKLDETQVTDAGLAQLRGLTELEWLSLNETQVTDAGLIYLKGLTSLKDLYLVGTPVTDTGADELKRALPRL